ncbi:DNA cytosine methyltransferase [Alphaproteobacteria bacterium]|nr:DNA cytosine methyltransferase [Alphaproteobacteria bacterium]
MRDLRCLSIFSGGGGMDIGFEDAGFHLVGATDLDEYCAKTFELNRPKIPFKVGRATDYSKEYFLSFVDKNKLKDLDCLIGGPPCPSFSKSRFYRTEKPRGVDDLNADETIKGYLKTLEDLRPKRFVLENVKGLTYKVHARSLELIVSCAESLGYSVDVWTLNSADYGTPQIRERSFVIGSLDNMPIKPRKTHSKKSKEDGEYLPGWIPVGDVISELPSNGVSDIPGHFAGGKHHNLLAQIPPGDNYLFLTEKRGHPNPQFRWRSRYWSFLLKLSPDLPSWTIQARRSNNMGPLHWDNRMLTIDEVKRIQTFPDNWKLAGSVEKQWRQVGNAVPCKLAKSVGGAIVESLK